MYFSIKVSPLVFKDQKIESDDFDDRSEEERLAHMKIPKADFNILRQYLNAEYLKPESMLRIRQSFIDESSIQLHDFLNEDVSK